MAPEGGVRMEQLGLGLDDSVRRKLDVLETTAYARCPKEYFHRWIERSIHTASGPLVVRGRNLHSALVRWMALPPSDRTEAALLGIWRTATASNPDPEFDASLVWWARHPLSSARVQMTERSVCAVADEFLVKGRLDAVLQFENRVWVVDYKLRREALPSAVIWDQVILLAAAVRRQYAELLPGPVTLAYVYFEEREIETLQCESLPALEGLLGSVLVRARMLDGGDYPPRRGGQCGECGARWRCDHARSRD